MRFNDVEYKLLWQWANDNNLGWDLRCTYKQPLEDEHFMDKENKRYQLKIAMNIDGVCDAIYLHPIRSYRDCGEYYETKEEGLKFRTFSAFKEWVAENTEYTEFPLPIPEDELDEEPQEEQPRYEYKWKSFDD